MNIVGEGFPDEIVKQVQVRQDKLGSLNRSDETLLWMTTKTGWVRMVSSVNVTQTAIRNLPYTGDELAKNFVLFGGTSVGKNNLRSGIWPGTSQDFNSYAYGMGGSDMGLKPMPGINSAEIKTETRGSLRTSTIKITAHNQQQFDIIDLLYMRLGYSVLLEWGHSSFYYNNGTYETDNPFSLADEFLGGTLDYNNHLQTIQSKRLASNGNYDAVVGKVVNFNWTFNKDGSYDITVILRSMGDVVESLKMNLFTPISGSTATTPPTSTTPPPPIEAYANAHQIGNWFYRNKQLFRQGTNYLFNTGTETTGYKDTNFSSCSFLQQNSTQGIQYYVRFGRFLSYLQNQLIPYVTSPGTPLLGIDYTVDDNIIPLHPRQIPCDPSVCIFKCNLNDRTERYVNGGVIAPTVGNIIPQADQFINPILTGLSTGLGYNYSTGQIAGVAANTDYAWVMNIYFNCNWVLTKLNELKNEEGKVPVFDLIKSFCSAFNSTTGQYNRLEPIVNEDNKIVILDQTPNPNRDTLLTYLGLPTQTAFFNTYGFKTNSSGSITQGSFIKDFNFTTTITPELATLITIGATSNGYVVGQDATALSRMNAGLEDRFKPTIKNPNLNPNNTTPPTPAQTLDTLSNDFKIEASLVYRGLPGSVNIYNFSPDVMSSTSNLLSQLIEFDLAESLAQGVAGSTTNTGFLPFDLSLIMEGLSGMKVYQKLEADTRFFPSNYPQTLDFLIKGIKNTISNNVWNTTLETLAVPKDPYGLSTPANTTTTTSPTSPAPPASGTSNSSGTTFYRGQDKLSFQVTFDFLKEVLIGIGIPNPNQYQLQFMKIWKQAEKSKAAWNPFNTTLTRSGSKPHNAAGNVFVQNYTSRAQGLEATISTINSGFRYAGVVQSIKDIRNEAGVANAMEVLNNSPWGTHFQRDSNGRFNPRLYRTITNPIYGGALIPR